MKYKVGDRVRIKSIDWYNENKSKSHGTVACGGKYFDYDMREWCGKTMTIIAAHKTCYSYIMKEDGRKYFWTDEMIEGLSEEETLIERVDDNGLPFNEWLSHKGAFYVPEDYVLKDENNNEILTSKIILEKKKKEYPKTYEECFNICFGNKHHIIQVVGLDGLGDNKELFESFIKLKLCRDAYWKIAGEEMGLGKPWEPDYESENCGVKYCIGTASNEIIKCTVYTDNSILSFPTTEMRDAFYENFKELIEQCKELL